MSWGVLDPFTGVAVEPSGRFGRKGLLGEKCVRLVSLPQGISWRSQTCYAALSLLCPPDFLGTVSRSKCLALGCRTRPRGRTWAFRTAF